jgi:hypothetical protein
MLSKPESTLLLTVLALGLVSVPYTFRVQAQAAPVARIDPQQINSLNVGDNFTVYVWVDNAVAINAAQVQLTYDPRVLNATLVAEGPFLPSAGPTVVAQEYAEENLTSQPPTGAAYYASSIINGGSANDSGILLNVTFTILSQSASLLHLLPYSAGFGTSGTYLLDVDFAEIIPGLEDGYYGLPVLSILPTDSGYLNDKYFYYVVGEVNNTGNITATDVYVNATFYNFTGDVVAEIMQPTELYTILPSRTSPFDATLFSTVESQKVYNYTLRIVQYSATQNGQLGLMIMSSNSSVDSNGLRIGGTVENVGNQTASFTRVIATFYNASGRAIATASTYSSPSLLDINQTAPFQILLNTSEARQVDHYSLTAEADDPSLIADYETIAEFQPMILAFTLLILTTTITLISKRYRRQTRSVWATKKSKMTD